jgi:hypothetical protein
MTLMPVSNICLRGSSSSKGGASFLCVIKDCGPASEAYLSFPVEGTTLALDLPYRGAATEALVRLQIQQGGRPARFNSVELEQGQSERACPASDRTDSQTLAHQFGKHGEKSRSAMKNHERLVRNAPQRNQLEAIWPVGHATLHKSYVHVDRRVLQPFQILHRAARGKDFQSHPVARQDLTVLKGVGFKGASRRAAGDNQRFGRSGVQEPEDTKHHYRSEQYRHHDCSGVAESKRLHQWGQDSAKNTFALWFHVDAFDQCILSDRESPRAKRIQKGCGPKAQGCGQEANR